MIDLFYLNIFLFIIGFSILIAASYIPTSNDPLQKNKIWIFYLAFGFIVMSAFLMFRYEIFNQVKKK